MTKKILIVEDESDVLELLVDVLLEAGYESEVMADGADIVAMAEKARKGIIAGTVHPFAGPIKNQKGEIVVPAGKNADDGMLAGMNFYVEGVDGKIPK